MSRYFLEIVREEAAVVFPPKDNRRKSEVDPFNISAFTNKVFGPQNQKAWRRLSAMPHTLTLDVAAKMAEAVGRPLSEMVSDANKLMRRASAVSPAQERTGTLGA